MNIASLFSMSLPERWMKVAHRASKHQASKRGHKHAQGAARATTWNRTSNYTQHERVLLGRMLRKARLG